MIIRTTSAEPAPRAMRTPISWRLATTDCAITDAHAESRQRDGESGEHDEENCRGPMLQRRGGEGVFERADRAHRLLRIHLGD